MIMWNTYVREKRLFAVGQATINIVATERAKMRQSIATVAHCAPEIRRTQCEDDIIKTCEDTLDGSSILTYTLKAELRNHLVHGSRI